MPNPPMAELTHRPVGPQNRPGVVLICPHAEMETLLPASGAVPNDALAKVLDTKCGHGCGSRWLASRNAGY